MTRFVSGHVLAPRFHTLRIALLAALIGIAAGALLAEPVAQPVDKDSKQ